MKFQHAKHVIHQHSVLCDRRLALDEAHATLRHERNALEKLPDAIRQEIQRREGAIKDIDEQIANLSATRIAHRSFIEDAHRQIATADTPLAAKHEEINANRAEYDRLTKKLQPFARELDEAKALVAQIAEREKARLAEEAAAAEKAKAKPVPASASPTYVIVPRA